MLLFAIAQTAAATIPESDQLSALIEGAILPSVQSSFNDTGTNKILGFNVVIIGDAVLKKNLSEKYVKYSTRLKFESEDAIIFRSFKKGKQAEGYFHKATGQPVCVNRFEVISSKENRCYVKWSNDYASLGGFTKIVTLTFSDNKWVVVEVKLKTVS
jgi:hypothetical protein